MQKHLLAVVFAVLAATSLHIVTSQAQEPRVGFVDFETFASKSVKFHAQNKKFMDLLNAKREALEAKRKELQKIGAYPAQDRSTCSEIAAFESSERDMMMASLRQDLSKIISRIRALRGLAMVFNREALLWTDEAVDLTDEVAKAYDAEEEQPRWGPAVRPQTPSRGMR
jgi:Skp family chaperone for outer membrane proteins